MRAVLQTIGKRFSNARQRLNVDEQVAAGDQIHLRKRRIGDRVSSFHVQIFGTDLNDKDIQKARAGVYRDSIADEISAERMQRVFVKVDEGYRVNKSVRDICVFARQNLAGFAKVDDQFRYIVTLVEV